MKADCGECGQTTPREETMAKLRHIAIIVPDPEAAAQFYEKAFEIGRAHV